MQCPRCQHEKPPQAKFCLECDARFVQPCGKCGTELPQGAKFYLECGQAVVAAATAQAPLHLKRTVSRGSTLWQFALPLLLAGCTVAVPLNPPAEHLPRGARLPLTVGVYYGAGFQDYEYEDRYRLFSIPVGRASALHLSRVFGVMFDHVSVIDRWPPLPADTQTLTAVIQPTIEAFDMGSGVVDSSEVCWAEIIYRFDLWSSQGVPIVSWMVSGVGTTEGAGSASANGPTARAADLAMQNAAAQLSTVFEGVPEVRKWLRTLAPRSAESSEQGVPRTPR